MTRRKILLFLSGVVVFFLAWFGASYYLSLRVLVINYENISSVSIYSGVNLSDRPGQKPVKIISQPGQEIKLKKGSYVLQYDAKDNYRDYFDTVELKDKRQTVSLSPDYSDEYLAKLLDAEINGIKKEILQKYPKVSQLYDIQKGRLYKKGDWYGTTLVYKGSVQGANLFKTDTLRVILKKENGTWALKTTPPTILITKSAHPDVPEDILRSVNSMSASPTG